MEGPEMTEMASKVYDLIYARPVLSLMELSSIAISIRLWRWKIRRHIKNKNLNKLHFLDDIPLQSILPKNTATPPVINRIVEKQVKNLQYSMLWWKITHNMDIFQLQHPFDYNFPLRNVNNFSYDYDGTVHWTRTAKRMMMCARFSEREKFKIACMYCFEDDIRRIWPSVSNELDSEKCVFGIFPNLCYWIYYLRNEMNNIPISLVGLNNEDIFEELLDRCESKNWSAAEYFWNRISSRRRYQKALDLYNKYGRELFTNVVLPRLSKSELDRFLAEKGAEFIADLLKDKKT